MTSSAPERFHALDATRGFALLLGIVFHIGWAFMPENAGVPYTDQSSSVGFSYFFHLSHTFRMQLFFLIAGFFGRMLYHRRGAYAFSKNRLSRIAFPLLASWVVLAPLIILTWMWGGNLSGQNLTPVPLSAIAQLLAAGLFAVPRSWGGMFTLGHLWFLYYLLIFYALTLMTRPLLARWATSDRALGKRLDTWVAWSIRSPWAIVVLTILTGLSLWPMSGWYGIDTPSLSPMPSVFVILAYGLFFAFGWLLHRQTSLLQETVKHWRWQLAAGIAVSIPMFLAVTHLRESGIANGMFDRYPELGANQITDWPTFLNRLNTDPDDPEADPELLLLIERMAPTDRERVASFTPDPKIDLKIGLCKSFNRMMLDPDLFEATSHDADGRSVPSSATPEETHQSMLENRLVVERIFSDSLVADPANRPYAHSIKLGYSILYGFVSWSLVFASLGFFQERCSQHSRVWRYVADSSYWIYLIHIPLVIWLQILVADWGWPGFVKFLLLNVVSFTILFLSYHFLVRSTILGQILNGRKYRFQWPGT